MQLLPFFISENDGIHKEKEQVTEGRESMDETISNVTAIIVFGVAVLGGSIGAILKRASGKIPEANVYNRINKNRCMLIYGRLADSESGRESAWQAFSNNAHMKADSIEIQAYKL